VLTVCWSCKGGVGTTVVAALAALKSAVSAPTLAVGLNGDLAAALGMTLGPDEAGFGEWVAASPDVAGDALARLGHHVAPDLAVVAPGSPCDPTSLAGTVAALGRVGAHVVFDAGRADLDPVARMLAEGADSSLLVTRRCYLALRRCSRLPVSPTGVVVVSERGRALGVADVERVVGVPVVADIAVDSGLARTVDAGLLASRLPRGLLRSLDRVA
jgi:hypothetical protein